VKELSEEETDFFLLEKYGSIMYNHGIIKTSYDFDKRYNEWQGFLVSKSKEDKKEHIRELFKTRIDQEDIEMVLHDINYFRTFLSQELHENLEYKLTEAEKMCQTYAVGFLGAVFEIDEREVNKSQYESNADFLLLKKLGVLMHNYGRIQKALEYETDVAQNCGFIEAKFAEGKDIVANLKRNFFSEDDIYTILDQVEAFREIAPLDMPEHIRETIDCIENMCNKYASDCLNIPLEKENEGYNQVGIDTNNLFSLN
jgi:hypothetical protein